MGRFVLRSDRTFVDGAFRPAAVVVEGERIAAVLDAPPAGLPLTDLGATALLPGLVDAHVHINEPGRTEWEGFTTATRAAAAGGVTTLVDMPLNCTPVTTTAEALTTKLEAVRGQLQVDCGFWGGVVPPHLEQLDALAAAGVLGCKAFMCHSGIDDFPASDEATLRAAMPKLAAAGIPLLAHAELELGAQPKAPPTHYAHWLQSRPPEWEDAAIALLIELCRETGCAVHVVHLSSAQSLPQIRAAKAEGLPFTVETCPHYLCLSAEQAPDDTTWKCAPPIRDEANRAALWAGLDDGSIDFVVTDHSPCTPHLKAGDFDGAWGGIASLQLGLPNLWTEARARGLSLERVVHWLSEAPADFAGLPHKGRIEPGADADLVAFDPEARWTIEPGALHFRHKVSPYLGREVFGRIESTWLRGAPAWQDGEFPAPRGRALLHRGRP